MEEILDTLVKIQTLDDEIKAAKSKRDEIPNKIATLEKEIDSAKRTLQEKQSRIQDIKKTYKVKEGDLAENETKITKLNSQTFAVKTNEEYRAILSEIDYLKRENKKTEDEMMTLLEEEENLKSTIGKIETETQTFVSEKMQEISNLKKSEEELTEMSKEMKLNFDEHFNKLPHDAKELYKKIKKVRGKVVCTTEDQTCTGCYANFAPQFLNELKKRNKIILCDNCGRILIYPSSGKELS